MSCRPALCIAAVRMTLQLLHMTWASVWFSLKASAAGCSYSMAHLQMAAPACWKPSDSPPQPAKMSMVRNAMPSSSARALHDAVAKLQRVCWRHCWVCSRYQLVGTATETCEMHSMRLPPSVGLHLIQLMCIAACMRIWFQCSCKSFHWQQCTKLLAWHTLAECSSLCGGIHLLLKQPKQVTKGTCPISRAGPSRKFL